MCGKVSITMSSTERVKRWREANREHFRAYQREWKRRKRMKVKAARYVAAPSLPLAPDGYDPAIDGDLRQWCLMHGIPLDPSKW